MQKQESAGKKSTQSAQSAWSAWSAQSAWSAVCSLQSAWCAFWGDRIECFSDNREGQEHSIWDFYDKQPSLL